MRVNILTLIFGKDTISCVRNVCNKLLSSLPVERQRCLHLLAFSMFLIDLSTQYIVFRNTFKN